MGIRRNRGTREAILSFRLIIERAFIRKESVYIGFIILEKAFSMTSIGKLHVQNLIRGGNKIQREKINL